MKDLGLLTLFSGLEVVQFAKGIFINQHKYTTDLTHMTTFNNSTLVEVPILARISPMQLICWVNLWRLLAMFIAVVQHIIRYLLGMSTCDLFFPASSCLTLTTYSDANWAGYPNTRRSTTEWCMYLGKWLISWKYKKQERVSKSSTETVQDTG